MVFSSLIFLFFFLPIVLAVYHLVSIRVKDLVLLLFSILFYTWGEDIVVLVMLTSSLVDYFCGILIEKGKRKLGLGISIFTNLSFLGFFKYFNFTFDNFNALLSTLGLENTFWVDAPHIALPMGISFYTFQTLSYSIDVYKGRVKANRNFIQFATYVTMFPQLVAGPIVRYTDIQKQLVKRDISLDKFSLGVERFIVGLAKKMLIANTFALIADDIFGQDIQDVSTFYIWVAVVSYAIQIYFDFSGYSDMAIGLGKMFGFDFLENFNYPYISRNIREFWQRWHISLSSWFRDYLYIPLGGNKKGNIRTYINLFIVFFVTGLWHGASWNFIVWGLFHGFFLILERAGLAVLLEKIWRPIQHVYTLLIVLIGWVFFRADNLSVALTYLKKMFVFNSGDQALSSYLDFYHINLNTILTLVLAMLFSLPVYTKINYWFNQYHWLKVIVFLGVFFVTIGYLVTKSYNPFIYFRF